MKTESFVFIFAGTMILASLALVYFFGQGWLFFTGFIGLNLIQSAFTGFCPPTLLLRKLGWVDADGVIHWGGQQSNNRRQE